MEREYLVEGLIVVVVLLVLFVGFLSLFPEAREQIEDFSMDILGLGFAKSPEEIKATVKLARDSFDLCSVATAKNCVCDVEIDIVPGDYKIVIDNSGSGSKFILLDGSDYIEGTWDLGGRKVGFPGTVDDKYAYCDFNSMFVLTYDSGWSYMVEGFDFERVLVSSDGVSQYPVIKLDDGNFCFIDEYMVEYELDVDEKGISPEGLVKIGEYLVEKGTFSDYYSGKKFFESFGKCQAVAGK
ncbi:MAG: hypothetical protein V1914_04400 [archaeon]